MAIDTLNIYLPAGLCKYLARGKKHPFFTPVVSAFNEIGFRVNIVEDTDSARLASMVKNAYAMFHYKDPFHDHALDARSAYIGPFYKLESETYRQDYRTSGKVFRPARINPELAQRFFRNWQANVIGQPVPEYRGTVFIPLQGKLTRRRVGQSMSPIDMLETTLELEQHRDLVIKKHPREDYTPQELTALDKILRHPRAHLIEGELNNILAGCDYVVTQNSSVALKGLFHKKPGILFAHSEYHHVFQNVTTTAAETCFENVLKHPPAYAKYLFWYLQRNCINTSREFVKQRILEQCREFGWKL